MDYNYTYLLEKFKNISKKMWVKGINSNTNNVGLTFEALLNKKSDSMYFPDYQGIEIKCTQRYSRYPISLFSLTFDGPSLYEMNQILNKYGKHDHIYKDKKILMASLSCKTKTLINGKYYFKLDVSFKEQKLYLEVYNREGQLIEKNAFIYFETIKERIKLKLSMLALVWASKRVIDEDVYFRYYKINIYKLISFSTFIELVKEDLVQVDIVGRVSRSGDEKGRQRNKNLVFKIKKENINKLFECLETYDADEAENFQIL